MRCALVRSSKVINLFFLLFASIALAQNSLPPVVVVGVEPHSHVKCALVSLGTDDADPWGSCLVVAYKNVSSQAVTGIRFEVNFISALKESEPSVYAYEDTRKVKPGKMLTAFWHDGVYWHKYGDKMEASVVVAKVMFADGTFWTAQSKESTVTVGSDMVKTWESTVRPPGPSNEPSVTVDSDMVEATVAGFELTYPSIRILSISGSKAAVHADNADQGLCSLFHMSRVSLRQLGLTRVDIANGKGLVCEVDVTRQTVQDKGPVPDWYPQR